MFAPLSSTFIFEGLFLFFHCLDSFFFFHSARRSLLYKQQRNQENDISEFEKKNFFFLPALLLMRCFQVTHFFQLIDDELT